jgi:hypothetical protein
MVYTECLRGGSSPIRAEARSCDLRYVGVQIPSVTQVYARSLMDRHLSSKQNHESSNLSGRAFFAPVSQLEEYRSPKPIVPSSNLGRRTVTPLAQLDERQFPKLKVAGSNPVWRVFYL